MSLIMPRYEYIKQEMMDHKKKPDYVINCSSGVNDTLRIWKDGGGDGASVAFYIEDEHGEMSPNVFVNQKVLPELIQLLQSMREEKK